jgi:Rps23 Pro-64 3,4-dihydroxylase Tpa1-like proline 4-hydroxylase
MSSPQVVQHIPAPEQSGLFPYAAWEPRLADLSRRYRDHQPVPHIFLTDFLQSRAAHAMMQEFPGRSTEAWTHYQHQNENKLGMTKRQLFPPTLGEAVDELNSPRFLEWLSGLTGIPGLLADPMLEGGGLHQSGRSGFLNVHTDFSHHHYHKNWRRRINLILYLNEGWRDEWGGAIELWDSEMKRCVAKYPPQFNQALIFNTDERSYHGFPEPLQCPEGASRKSLALYYYTVDNDPKPAERSTNYRARPQDGAGKALMIWLDKKAVEFYSRAKSRFGFSDEFASRMLAMFSRKH